MANWIQIFLTFLRLGLTSFGGPIAHLSYFHGEFVVKKKWLDEESYADLVALCQFLPGPTSSEVGIAIGFSQGAFLGSIAAWLGFTLPSAIILVIFALGISHADMGTLEPWLHGLKIAAVAVVAQAIWVMSRKLCPDKERILILLSALGVSFFMPSFLGQVISISLGAMGGFFLLKPHMEMNSKKPLANIGRIRGSITLFIFGCLLFFLPLLSHFSRFQEIRLFDVFFRSGALVFGGGHAVLPLLQAEVVPSGWVSNDIFMAGYGAAQAIPGPLFSFAAYLGAVSKIAPNGVMGALICLLAVFCPSFFLVIGTVPFWNQLRNMPKMGNAMRGINAAVVGVLAAAFLNTVWPSAIFSFKDFILAGAGFGLLFFASFPSWAVVLLCGLIARVNG